MQEAMQSIQTYLGPQALDWPRYLTACVLVLLRVSGVMVFIPLFSSPAIPVRVKAAFTITISVLLAPVVCAMPAVAGRAPRLELDAASILGELGVGLVFGLTLNLLTEAMMYAGTLLGLQFSFGLVNLLDPNSKVDTAVLSELLNWILLLVIIGAGLDRAVLGALMRTFVTAPPGLVALNINSCAAVGAMAGGIFLAGMQLAAPVMSATILTEIAVAMIGRLSPQLPITFVSVPVKTLVAYAVLIISFTVWPRWIESHFLHLLDAAQGLVAL